MSRGAQKVLGSSKRLAAFSVYARAFYEELRDFVWDEEDALQFKGQWRQKVFKAPLKTPLDLEIGTGTGEHLVWRAARQPERLFLGMELKYKPLVQTARRLKRQGLSNARVIRYNGRWLGRLFQESELNHVYIHFPDPWPKSKHHKHRLIKPDFVQALHQVVRQACVVEIKTDSRHYAEEIKSVFASCSLFSGGVLNKKSGVDSRFRGNADAYRNAGVSGNDSAQRHDEVSMNDVIRGDDVVCGKDKGCGFGASQGNDDALKQKYLQGQAFGRGRKRPCGEGPSEASRTSWEPFPASSDKTDLPVFYKKRGVGSELSWESGSGFVTPFEKIFLKQNKPIYHFRYRVL